jgi:hypothetical protein
MVSFVRNWNFFRNFGFGRNSNCLFGRSLMRMDARWLHWSLWHESVRLGLWEGPSEGFYFLQRGRWRIGSRVDRPSLHFPHGPTVRPEEHPTQGVRRAKRPHGHEHYFQGEEGNQARTQLTSTVKSGAPCLHRARFYAWSRIRSS